MLLPSKKESNSEAKKFSRNDLSQSSLDGAKHLEVNKKVQSYKKG